VSNVPFTKPPSAKTVPTIRAAIAATMSPYSTADAPFSAVVLAREKALRRCPSMVILQWIRNVGSSEAPAGYEA
jgi:hypothetical protein